MMKPLYILGLIAVMAGTVSAGLVDTRVDTAPGGASVDGMLGANEYGAGNAYSYAGGGGGFGGTLGAGALYMNSSNSDLFIGFDPANNLNDNVVIYLDTRTGGFGDSAMDDTADGGRKVTSNLTRDVNDIFPIGADFSVVIGNWGIVVFELNSGNTPGHLGFVSYSGSFTGNDPNLFREISLPLATLGITGGTASNVDFFVGYSSDSNYVSNESIPAQPFNGGGNIGFDNNGGGDVNWVNFDRFTTVPEPATMTLLALGGLLLARRRGH